MSFRGTGSGKQVSSRTNRLHSRGRNPQKGLRAASESEAYLTLSHAINNDGHTNSGFKCSTIPHHKWEIFKRFAHTTRPDLGQSANNDIYARQSQEPNIPSQKAKHKKQDPYSTRVIIHSATAHGPDAQLSTGTCLHWQPTSFLLSSSRLPLSPPSPPPHAADIVVLLRIPALSHNPLPIAIVDPIGFLRAAPPPSLPTMTRFIES